MFLLMIIDARNLIIHPVSLTSNPEIMRLAEASHNLSTDTMNPESERLMKYIKRGKNNSLRISASLGEDLDIDIYNSLMEDEETIVFRVWWFSVA